MTNTQLVKESEKWAKTAWRIQTEYENLALRKGYFNGFTALGDKIIQHLKSLPLESMTGKEVEESLFNEFLHIQ